MKKLIPILMLVIPVVMTAQENTIPSDSAVIIYENDAHGTLSGYPRMATLKAEALSSTSCVLTVSGGDFSTDFIPAPAFARNTKGEGIVKIMNAVGYDFAIPGNHDFDFSVDNLLHNAGLLDATILCCNFIDAKSGEPLFRSFGIRECAGQKIAFIGVATPKTVSRHTESLFNDAEGNPKYSFCEADLIGLVQQNIDKARAEGADRVVVISHLGDRANGSVTSIDLIAATVGIDVVLDAHAHSVIPGDLHKDKDGRDVMLCSTGLKFANIGRLVISREGCTYINIPADTVTPDAAVQAAVDSICAGYPAVEP